jgi:hypothetical protein
MSEQVTIFWDETPLSMMDAAGDAHLIGMVDCNITIDWDETGDWTIANIDVLSLDDRKRVALQLEPDAKAVTERALWLGTCHALMGGRSFRDHVGEHAPDDLVRALVLDHQNELAYHNWRRF